MLIDPARLEREYFEGRPDLDDPNQRVSFGTSGHRGSPLRGSFTEAHILAITQAICDYRRVHGTHGPLYMGKDTHADSVLKVQQKPLSRMVMVRGDKAITGSFGEDAHHDQAAS
jgi:phosphoglucomutase